MPPQNVDVNIEVSMQRLVEGHGVKLRGKGPALTGTCPFHTRSSPTITIDTISNTWACKTCRVSDGTPTTFTMRSKNVSRKLAVELLRAEIGGGGVEKKKLPSVITSNVEDPKLFEEIVTYYQDSLKRDPKAQEFLVSSGIKDSGVLDAFAVGVSDRTLGYRLPDRQVKAGREIRERLIRTGILRDSGHETLRGCITIPLFDAHNNITGIYGRRFKIDTRKTDSPDVYVGSGFVNTAAVAASNDLVLTSTPFESLVVWSSGTRNVTAIMPGSMDALMGMITNASKIVLVLPRTKDGDNQVKEFTDKLKKTSPKTEIFRALLPAGMDVVQTETASPGSIPEIVRTAEWLAGVRPTTTPIPAEPKVSIEDAQTSEPEKTTAAPTGDVTIDIGDRRWRVRGMNKNTSYDSLKVNIRVHRESKDPRSSGVHVDTIELYAARQRAHFVDQAAEEVGVSREVIKRDLGQVLLRLEALQDEQIKATLEPKEAAPTMTDQEKAEALRLLRDPSLLDRVLEAFEVVGVVGERTNKLVGYLAAVSRLLPDPLAILVQSSSAAGKSSLLDAVLELVPEEHRVEFSAMTGQALYYMETGALRHKVLAISEEEGASRAAYALKLLQSAGSLTIASTAKEAGTGRMTTHEYRVDGPVALMMTTTATEIDPELANRCLVLAVDEGAQQTKAIHERQRAAETLEGFMANREREALVRLHQNAQRLLLPLLVVNPFAPSMAFSSSSTRARRDHRKLLTLVRAVALLHQHQRTSKKLTTADRAVVEYIEVERADIELAQGLVLGLLGEGQDDLPPHTRGVLHLLGEFVGGLAKTQDIETVDVRFTRRQVREALHLGGTQAWTHIRRLVDAEYLVVHPSRNGRGVVYQLAGSIGTTHTVRGSDPTVRGSFGPNSGHVRTPETGTPEPDLPGEAPDRSGSDGSNHRAPRENARRTSRSNGIAT